MGDDFVALGVLWVSSVLRCVIALALDEPILGEPALAALLVVALAAAVCAGGLRRRRKMSS